MGTDREDEARTFAAQVAEGAPGASATSLGKILGALTILGYAEELAGTSQIRQQRYALNRTLAERLAEDWPLEALRQYVAMPEDEASIAAAGALLEALGEGPSVWLDLSAALARWDEAARGIAALSGVRATVIVRVTAANERAVRRRRLIPVSKGLAPRSRRRSCRRSAAFRPAVVVAGAGGSPSS